MMPDRDPNTPMVGDRVRVVVPAHAEGHDTGTVRQVVNGALGIEFDSAPGRVHQWYVPSEVMVLREDDDEEEDDAADGDEMRMATPAVGGYRYERYISHVVRQPWCITPEKLGVLFSLMRLRASGHRLSDGEIAQRLAAEGGDMARQTGARSDGTVAVIPIVGTIAHRADSFSASSGGTSTQRIGAFLRRAVADESVKSILLDISSPGGSVEGVPELAAQIAAAADVKPVVAMANALSASAAYWLGSQATEFVVTPSGMVGSIGVYLLLFDESRWLEKEGVTVNAISAGDNKLEGAPWQALSDESRAFFQSEVDRVYGDFLKAVATGRGVPVATVKRDFGQGRVYSAKEALSRGMVDRIATVEDTLDRMLKAKGPMKRRHHNMTGAVSVDEGLIPAAQDPVDATVEDQRPPAPSGTQDDDYRRTRLALARRRQGAA